MDSTFLHEYRCDCGKLLFKGLMITSHIEIKCSRCGQLKTIPGIVGNFSVDHFYTLLVDEYGNILNASQSIKDVLGYDKEEMQGLQIQDINPTEPPGLFERMWQAIKDDPSTTFRYGVFHKRKDGKMIPLDARIKLFTLGDKDFILCIFDQPNKEKENNQPTEDTSQFSGFVDRSCDLMVDLNPKGVITFISDQTKDWFGYEPNEMLGKSLFDFYTTEKAGEIREYVKNSASNRQPFRIIDNHMIDRNGGEVIFDSYVIARYDDAGRFVGYRAINWGKK